MTPQSKAYKDRSLFVERQETLEVLVLGDTGNAIGNQREVFVASLNKQCEASHLDAVLLLGDNFYPKGVSSTEDPQWQNKFRSMFKGSCFKDLPIYAILGNHDYKGNPAAQIEYTQLDKNWIMPARFYGVRFGDLAQFVMWDSEIFDWCGLGDFCGVDYLLQKTKTRSTRWRIVLSHHPIVSSSQNPGGRHGRSWYSPLMKGLTCRDVDLWMSGHAHFLEHYKDPRCKTHYLVSGGGGANLRKIKAGEYSLFSKRTYGFAKISLSNKTAQIEFYDWKNLKLWDYTVEKR